MWRRPLCVRLYMTKWPSCGLSNNGRRSRLHTLWVSVNRKTLRLLWPFYSPTQDDGSPGLCWWWTKDIRPVSESKWKNSGRSRSTDYSAMHAAREMQRVTLEETVEYKRQHAPTAMGSNTPREILEYELRQAQIDGHSLEFGVYEGETFRFIAGQIGEKEIRGFDSFQGLPREQ